MLNLNKVINRNSGSETAGTVLAEQQGRAESAEAISVSIPPEHSWVLSVPASAGFSRADLLAEVWPDRVYTDPQIDAQERERRADALEALAFTDDLGK